ncbi:hypothetical protein CEV08_02865 [Bartonella tribocorum]|uniref:Uncharacterized protein n=1 Tax=Bartonella tribocorum TaxID=85701 RepID=A0A2M6UX40_9HYPH|nr:hypothetical protein CEV08_02865 [Bartonella tribocorum]
MNKREALKPRWGKETSIKFMRIKFTSNKIIFVNRVRYFLSFKRFLYEIFGVRVFLFMIEKN